MKKQIGAIMMAACGGSMIVAATFPIDRQGMAILLALGATLAWMGIKGYDDA